jgi:predicted SprT family Zn-dependent metalloprotease
MDTDELQFMYGDFNRRFFSGVLPNVQIEWSELLGSCAGSFTPSKASIGLSTPLLKDRPQDLKDTLVHEMIHVYQWHKKIKDRPHGVSFSIVMDRINSRAKGEVFVTVRHDIFQVMDYEQNSLLGRIKKLLALSTSPNENEAYAAARKAQNLMAQNGVQYTDLSDVEEGSELDEPIINEVIDRLPRVILWKFGLLSHIANANYCECLNTRGIGLRVIGNKLHVEICRHYYQYFCQLVEREALQHKGKGSVFLNRFKEGMADGIGERLLDEFKRQQATAVQSNAIVLADRFIEERDKFLRHQFPNVRPHRSSRQQDKSASSVGRAAGSSVGTARHISSGAKRLGSG